MLTLVEVSGLALGQQSSSAVLELSADLVTLCTVNAWGMLHNSYRVNALDAWRELNSKQTKRTEGERRVVWGPRQGRGPW